MNAQALFNKFELQYSQLPGQLEGNSSEEFSQKWNAFFSQVEAENALGVIYIWTVDVPIPRLNGKSDILYIGKTIQSLGRRNIKYSQQESTGLNWKRYEYIFHNISPIKVLFAKVSNPKNIETEFLKSYSDEHLELPPFNRMSS